MMLLPPPAVPSAPILSIESNFVVLERLLTRSGSPVRLAVKFAEIARSGLTDAEWLQGLKVSILNAFSVHPR
jgi:hypothetical protein